MKITLKNFRCHRDATFQIPDEGLVLLSGESGVGKTTILNAILYAMYGNLRKPYSRGTTSCQVTLEIKGITITRSNRPNRVVVKYQDTEYEDEAAQGLIEKIFGMNSREFMSSSYVIQSHRNSVVSMTPNEQVEFIETLAFSDAIHIEYRKKFREAVKTSRKELARCEGCLSVAEKQVSLVRDDISGTYSFDINDIVEPKTVKKEKEDLTRQMQTIRKRTIILQGELQVLQEVKRKNKELEKNKRTLEIEISQYTQIRANLPEVLDQDKIKNLEFQLEQTNTLLSQTKSFHSRIKALEKIKKYQAELSRSLQTRIDKLKDTLLPQVELQKLEKKVRDLEKNRKTYESETAGIDASKKTREEATSTIKEIFAEAKKIFFRKNTSRYKNGHTLLEYLECKIKNLREDLSSAKYTVSDLEGKISIEKILGRVYACPQCSTVLSFEDGELCKASEVTENDGSDYQIRLISEKMNVASTQARFDKMGTWITLLRAALANLSKPVPKLTVKYNHRDAIEMEKRLVGYSRTLKDIEELKGQLSNLDDGSTTTSIIKDLRVKEEILVKGYPKDFTPNLEIETIKEQISQITSNLDEAWNTKSEWSSLTREISTREDRLRYVIKHLPQKKYLPSQKTRTISIVTEEMSTMQNSILMASSRLEELVKIIEHIGRYEIYQNTLTTLKKLQQQCSTYENERLAAEKALEGAMGLRAAGKEAEILAMEKTIESINEHAKIYLEELFKESILPLLHVRLEGTKITSRGTIRTQMNTVVEYNDGSDGPFDDLSGGEKQRIELAFLFSVNDMIGSQMILLDECLNNLGFERNMEILSYLRDFSGGKLILVVAPKSVQGVFNEIVTL